MNRPVVTIEQIDAFLREYAPEPPPPPPAPPRRAEAPAHPNGRPNNLVRRCSEYLKKVGPAVSGQRGHDRTFMAARLIWNDFGIDEIDGYAILEEYNRTCDPSWNPKDLRHKWDDAVEEGPGPEGRGYKARQNRPGYNPPRDHGPAGTTASQSGSAPPERVSQVASEQETKYKLIDTAEFRTTVFHVDWLVDWYLAKGEPAVIAGPSKAMKTSLLVDLAVSLATATPHLGKWAVKRRARTAMVSGESGRRTLQETFFRVMQAKGLLDDAADGWLKWEFTLPKLANLMDVADFAQRLAALECEVVVLDPMYLMLGGQVDAKNMFEMGNMLSAVSELLVTRHHITPVIAHHANRLLPIGEPMELQHLAYSGLEQFLRQYVFLNRRSAYMNDGRHELWIRHGGSAGHSGLHVLTIEEGVLGPDNPTRRWDVRIEAPEQALEPIRSMAGAQKQASAIEQMNLEDVSVLNAIDAEVASGEGGATITRIRERTRYGHPRAVKIVNRLVRAQAIEATKWTKGYGKNSFQETEGWCRTPE